MHEWRMNKESNGAHMRYPCLQYLLEGLKGVIYGHPAVELASLHVIIHHLKMGYNKLIVQSIFYDVGEENTLSLDLHGPTLANHDLA